MAPTPDTASLDTPAMPAMSEVCIPLESLKVDSEGDSAVAPAVGDPVEFTATGTVSRVEAGNAYITLESVNDAPLPETASADSGEPDEAAMRGLAATADEQPTP